ncbi:hypothetical protein Hanom_Chr04g00283391 [Helianthus anomalus]
MPVKSSVKCLLVNDNLFIVLITMPKNRDDIFMFETLKRLNLRLQFTSLPITTI